MKATTKKLITATFVLVIAIALAASSTYAWFAMSNETEIREFNVEVTAGENLLIAVSTVGGDTPALGDFKNYIAADEITGDSGAGQFFDLDGTVVEATATVLGLATADDDLVFTTPVHDLLDGEGAYFAFDVHFIADKAYEVMLYEGTAVASSGTSTAPVYVWSDVAGETFGNVELGAANAVILAYARNAVRIAFIDDSDFNVYEPNYDAQDSYGNYGGSDNLAIAHYNYKVGPTPALAAPVGDDPFETFVEDDFDATVLVTLGTTNVPTGAIAGTTYGKITVKIWLEGWDADAFDSIKTQVISTTLKFIGA